MHKLSFRLQLMWCLEPQYVSDLRRRPSFQGQQMHNWMSPTTSKIIWWISLRRQSLPPKHSVCSLPILLHRCCAPCYFLHLMADHREDNFGELNVYRTAGNSDPYYDLLWNNQGDYWPLDDLCGCPNRLTDHSPSFECCVYPDIYLQRRGLPIHRVPRLEQKTLRSNHIVNYLLQLPYYPHNLVQSLLNQRL